MIYAPIIIPTLCRYSHLKKCLDSLSKCTDADKTEVFIGVDYPLNDSHWEGYKKVCSLLESTTYSFKKITIVKRKENYGPTKNIDFLLKEHIYSKYDTFIFSEDDNEFSPNFLKFINANLERYKDDKDIYAICGYNYPLDFKNYPQSKIYKSFFYSPWGVGLWTDKMKKVSAKDADKILHNPIKVLKIGIKVPSLLRTLISMRYDNVVYGDALLRAKLFLEGKDCIFPILSKVRNRGFDITGVNCKDDGGIHLTQIIDYQIEYSDNEEIEVPDFLKMVNGYYRKSIFDRIKICMKYLLYILGVGKSKK